MKQYKFLTIMLIALVMLAALPAAAQSSIETNKALAGRWLEMWQGKPEIAGEIVADGFVAHFVYKPDEDWETYTNQTLAWMNEVLPDFKVMPMVTIGEGDMVASAVLWGGTIHVAEGVDPSRAGKEMWVSDILFWRVADGKIAEFWSYTNTTALNQQLGIIPVEGEIKPDTAWDITLEASTISPAERRGLLLNTIMDVNAHNIDTMMNRWTEDYAAHWDPMGVTLEGAQAILQSWIETPVEHRIAPQLVVIEGNLSATQYTMLPHVEGVPGLRTEIAVIERYEGDKLAEEWAIWDDYGLVQQIIAALPASE